MNALENKGDNIHIAMEISKNENVNFDKADAAENLEMIARASDDLDLDDGIWNEVEKYSAIRQRNNMVKIVGVNAIAYATLFCLITTLTIVSIDAPCVKNGNTSISPENININSSGSTASCVNTDSFPLTEDIFVNTCIKLSAVSVIVNDVRAGKNISLNLLQWQYLKASVSHVDRSIFHWKNQVSRLS